MTTRITPDLINGNLGLRNRLVNGSMLINQRGNTSFNLPSATGTYISDNWIAASNIASGVINVQTNSSIPAGSGLPGSITCITTTIRTIATGEYALLQTGIEGYRMYDLLFGNANAKTIALSFWVNATTTGTYGGSLINAGNSRSYPFTYTVNATNTWEQKTIVIPGDITGTWNNTTGLGVRINFVLGSGGTYLGTPNGWLAGNFFGGTGSSSILGAINRSISFAGVQFETGTAASSFDFRGYAQELADCQRYYYRQTVSGSSQAFFINLNATSTTISSGTIRFPVQMRQAPTALEQTGTAANYAVSFAGGALTNCSAVPSFSQASTYGAQTSFTVASGLTAGQIGSLFTTSIGATAYLGWSAEML
jgi:hypothetical protein